MKRKWALCIIFLIALVMGGCSGGNEEASSENEQDEVPEVDQVDLNQTGLMEAPMLMDLVEAGDLEPVQDRMPIMEDIMIEDVVEEIGQYGGEWVFPWAGPDDKWGIGKATEEALFRFQEDGDGIEPNVAKGYDVNEDSTEYIIYLREGMRWSDGEPFTADDVIFYWEHMLLPETFGKALYDCYYSVNPETGERVRSDVTKVDDYTIKVTHEYPSVLFLERLAIDNKWFFAPAHFYKDILPELIGEEEALEVASEWGYNDLDSFGEWTGYYFWLFPERPTLRPWVASNDPYSDRFIMERNPYYFKTDAEGNQLPYIDSIVLDRMQDDSHYLLETLAGNINLRMFGFEEFTVLKENEERGDYRILQWYPASWSSTGLQLNQTVEDPKLRELFQDIRFREALSVAVDRHELSEILTHGLGEPQQAAVPESLPNYQEGWQDQWVEYDVERANDLLDEIGLVWDENEEFRTFADGSELRLVIYQESRGESQVGTLQELLKMYYEEIGIKTDVTIADQGRFFDLKYDNQIPATTQTVSVVKVSYRPDELVPLRVITPWFGHYGLYHSSGGEEGVEPEGDVAKLLEYWGNLTSSTTSEDVDYWSEEIIKLHQENQWVIGYTGPTPTLVVASNDMRNIPDGIVDSDEFRGFGHAKPAQFFLKQD
ncbi:ABC transporter substrate-binding protein [Halalkalibacter sp. APA_J-10(15)]|uniref:ABC transporter substrate-binding protein n=1 Tax=Halalkalibacter sp. APA_J-10(15) TaxID=2933805 RepID=UPI001FF62CB3|nr:ABC transporter substrate-binding protein [Halalkalibacter sp. APA_J-10(15)]MCK0470214.1 ABC transporter substrate-binding protein [Halalkalibacter sp. APA_J-10(15)]